MLRLGLTGSIGMGKSTTADLFRGEGVPVIDADGIVHDLYRGEAVAPIGAAFPGCVVDGVVDRKCLSAALASEPDRFRDLEAIVHPLVWTRETALLDSYRESGERLVVLDIPLLFENKGEARVDKVVVVTCDPDIQRRRVLARPGMTEEKFMLILSRQMPDAEKRKRADYVIDTGLGIEHARADVKRILGEFGLGDR
ncbi:dephospho-CoA kinase [Rhizobium sp. TRM95796]|uniref:dephospho-CoA kinase n=1 Tax=Rhizobium sp. TRM95796 TaxID=2979862 RepID=UPI0021E949AF|nr:dephospho-CoA kinase [Rhizobium sp. TRM95796]MCV3767253.1 dephospho-CoA kinase [Rhizobium sp. TRM95796]